MKLSFLTSIIIVALFAGCSTSGKIVSRTVKASDILNHIKNKKEIVYSFCTIEGDLDFTKLGSFPISTTASVASIQVPLFFESCTFNGKVSAFAAGDSIIKTSSFSDNVGFYNCMFKDEVNFNGAVFKNSVLFTKSIFDKSVLLQGAVFENDLRVDEAFYSGNLQMQESVVRGSFWARQSTISGQLLMQQADFWQNALLAGISVHKYADFGLANFRRSSFFEYGEYLNRTNFNGAVFGGTAEWHKTKFRQSVDFSNASFLKKPVFSQVEIEGSLLQDNIKYLNENQPFNLLQLVSPTVLKNL